MGEHDGASGAGFWGSGEILVGFGRHRRVDARGRRRPSCRAPGVPLPLAPPCTGGNPRTSPGSSVVVVAPLLEGVAWCTVHRVLRAWWEFSGGRTGCGSSSFFVEPTLLALVSLFFLLVFLLGLLFAAAPACVVWRLYQWLYRGRCFIYKDGRKPVSWKVS